MSPSRRQFSTVVLDNQAVNKFRELIKREYGVEYIDEEAAEAAENLVGYFKTLIEIDSRHRRNTHT